MNNTLGTMSGMCSKLKFYFFSLLFPHRRTSISYSSPLHLLSLWRKEWISCLGHLGWEPRDAELCLFFLFSLKSSCQSNVCVLPFAPPSMNFTGPGPKRRLAGGEVCLIWSWVWAYDLFWCKLDAWKAGKHWGFISCFSLEPWDYHVKLAEKAS